MKSDTCLIKIAAFFVFLKEYFGVLHLKVLAKNKLMLWLLNASHSVRMGILHFIVCVK